MGFPLFSIKCVPAIRMFVTVEREREREKWTVSPIYSVNWLQRENSISYYFKWLKVINLHLAYRYLPAHSINNPFIVDYDVYKMFLIAFERLQREYMAYGVRYLCCAHTIHLLANLWDLRVPYVYAFNIQLDKIAQQRVKTECK